MTGDDWTADKNELRLFDYMMEPERVLFLKNGDGVRVEIRWRQDRSSVLIDVTICAFMRSKRPFTVAKAFNHVNVWWTLTDNSKVTNLQGSIHITPMKIFEDRVLNFFPWSFCAQQLAKSIPGTDVHRQPYVLHRDESYNLNLLTDRILAADQPVPPLTP